MHINSSPAADRLLTIHSVIDRCGISKASVYRMMRAGNFPLSTQLIPGGRRVGWRQSDIIAWMSDPPSWGEAI